MTLQVKLKFQRDDEDEKWFAKAVCALTPEDQIDEDKEMPVMILESPRVSFNRLPRAVNELLDNAFEQCRLQMTKFCESEVQATLDGRSSGGIVLPGAHVVKPPTTDPSNN